MASVSARGADVQMLSKSRFSLLLCLVLTLASCVFEKHRRGSPGASRSDDHRVVARLEMTRRVHLNCSVRRPSDAGRDAGARQGLRHPPQDETSGWYIWCGQELSDAADFFDPLHTRHLYEEYPDLVKLLGLPPGYRFILASDYLDVWYDASLLNV